MERVIRLPEISDTQITTHSVSSAMDEKGIILVYKGEKVVGSVIKSQDLFIMSLINDYQETYSLEEILIDYPDLTFKFID